MQSSATNGEHLPRDGFISGEWAATPSRNLLVRGEQEVHVEPRVMDVLVFLAERAGQVVSKDDLIAGLWQDRCVTDDVLTVTIYALRKALGDDARRPRYIETVSRRGYRWIAAVDPIRPPAPPSRLEAAPPLEAGAPHRYLWTTTVAAAVLALLVAGAVWTVTTTRRSRHLPSPEAREAYLKGRYFLDQRSIQGWRPALEQFERAVALDALDPAAHAGLADTYSTMSDFGVASPAEMRPRAMTAVQRALALDPQSAEGQEALGRAQLLFDWNFSAAERSLEQAIALDPDYMPAHQAMAWLKSARGDYGGAVAAAQRALQLDPVNTARYTELAWVLALSGRHNEASREIDRALQLNPRSVETRLMKGWVNELAGQPDAAFAAYREALRIGGAPDPALERLDGVYRAEGLAGYYRAGLNRRDDGNMPISDTLRAQFYVRAGQLDRALDSLERAYQKRESALAWVNVEPTFAALRSDVRFQKIAARVGGAHF